MKSSLLLLLVVAAVVVGADGGRGAFASALGTDSGGSKCASVPEDGAQWLQPLCNAIHRIAAGEKQREIKVDDGTTVGSAELWRNLNGTTVDIDFRYGTVGSHVIARLLSGSAFIPVDRVDQLVVRNAVLDGTLDLSHATIEVAAKFDRVVFNSRQQECPSTSAEPQGDALVLVGAEATKRLSIKNSIFCGDLRIAASRLHNGLQLGHAPHDLASDRFIVRTWFPSLFIVKSTIQGEVFIGHVKAADRAEFDRNSIDALTVAGSKFDGVLKISDNTMGALSVWETVFRDETSIVDNSIASSMKLNVVRFESKSRPVIRGNDVDGSLDVTIRETMSNAVDFSHNTVERSAHIWSPQGWHGSLDLDGSVFGSRLALCLARFDSERDTLRPLPAEVDSGLKSRCPQEPSLVTTVDLRSVQVAALAWRLPLDCSFRWSASGLRYEHWEETPDDPLDSEFECREEPKEDGKKQTRIGSPDGLMLMRHLMKDEDVDALNTMADYLESRGKIVESRNIREEAKRANYSNVSEQAGFFDGWSRRAASVALAPVGYGAKPELALIWLFGMWLVSYGVYLVYSHARRRDWPEKLKAESAAQFGEMKVRVVRRPTDQPRPVSPQEQPAAEAMIGQRAERQLLIEKRDDAGQRRGYSLQPGFMQFDKEKDPKDFDLFRYSIDAMVPVINLHTYDRYYPEHLGLRLYAALQHALGWFLITIFLISAAIL